MGELITIINVVDMERVTRNSIKDWVNEQFTKLEITEYECTKVERTYHTQDQYEAGACRLIVFFKNKTMPVDHVSNHGHFLCFYSLGYLQKSINNGYEMYLKYGFNQLPLLSNLEIELRKIKHPTP